LFRCSTLTAALGGQDRYSGILPLVGGTAFHVAKNWDDHIVSTEEVARTPGFAALRDRILELAQPAAGEHVVDVGAGTGLLALPLAEVVDRVWAIDISEPMCRYLDAKAASAGLENVRTATSSAVSLPLVDSSADLVVSNYCLHHLSHADKARALAEMGRVLRPGGRLVLGDMMFSLSPADPRSRRLMLDKVRGLLTLGPRGLLRIVKNALRVLTRSWEKPVSSDWWREALERAGFEQVNVEPLEHEGGIASARRPDGASMQLPSGGVPLATHSAVIG